MTMHDKQEATLLETEWTTNPRWAGITRRYSASDVVRLRGSIQFCYTLAEMGATRLWHLLHTEPFLRSLGALTGNQAVEMVRKMIPEELEKIKSLFGEKLYNAGKFPLAAQIFDKLANDANFTEFLTLMAYNYLD